MVTGRESFYQIYRKEKTQMSGPNPGGVQEPGPLGSGFSERPNEYGGYHRTLYDPKSDNHISWDTDRNGDYMDGTGHEDRDGRVRKQWD